MLRAFTIGFQKVYKSCLLLLMALSALMDTLLHCCQFEGSYYDCLCLKVPTMIVYDVTTKVLEIKKFPQHTIAELNSAIIFIVLFSQEKPLR